jgi:DNA invertase Pin-like site-specific DNA recombinase
MDKISGAKTERPRMNKCLKSLQPGEILIAWRLDRSLRPLITLVEDLRNKGFGFRSINEGAVGPRITYGMKVAGLVETSRQPV